MTTLKQSYTCLLLASLLGLASCTEWLDTAPEDLILADDAIQTEEDMQALLVSCYDVLANIYDGDVQLINELRGDNTAEPRSNLDLQAIYARETIRWTSYVGGMNREFYYPVLRANALLDAFSFVEGISADTEQRMRAEARFIRAFCFWGAVKIWAQPYGYTSDNSHLGIPIPDRLSDEVFPRATVAEVYAQIEEDLQFAIDNLPVSNGNYATQDAAKALLAQVKFLQMDFDAAAGLATEVLNTGTYELEVPDSAEAIIHLRLPNDMVSPETIFGIVSNPSISDSRNDRFRDWWIPTLSPELTLDPALWQWANQIAVGSAEDNRMKQWLEFTGEGKLWLKRFSDYDYYNVWSKKTGIWGGDVKDR